MTKEPETLKNPITGVPYDDGVPKAVLKERKRLRRAKECSFITGIEQTRIEICLLYTSDAADE